MTLLAAFQVLLQRYSGQDDIAVGVPIAGRSRPELEGLIGFFVNTLVLRGDLSGDPSFAEYLARVRARALDAYAHQDLPFEKVVEELAPSRDLSRNPLFQISFALQNTPPPDWRLDGLDVRATTSPTAAPSSISTRCRRKRRPARDAHRICPALFDQATIETMAQGARCLRRLSKMASASVLRCRVDRSARDRYRTVSRPIFRARSTSSSLQSRAHARSVAVREGTAALSYAELDARANQLARFLGAQGVQRGSLVAVAMERGVEMTVALLAVLKAGAAYLPLDPALPRPWLASMLEDAGQPPVLTQQRLLDGLPSGAGRACCIDRDWADIATHDRSDPGNRVTGGETASMM
jgi:non-ribosomal peptide synthetase component F